MVLMLLFSSLSFFLFNSLFVLKIFTWINSIHQPFSVTCALANHACIDVFPFSSLVVIRSSLINIS